MPTYKYSDVTSLVAKSFPKQIMDDHAATVANMALNKVWMRYDWPSSLSELPLIWMQPNTQDLIIPASIFPADLAGLREVRINKTNGRFYMDDPLKVEKHLDKTEQEGIPKAIAYQKEIPAYRLFPKTSNEYKAPDYYLSGIYKKLPTKITPATLNSVLPFDDIYFDVWLEVARWACMAIVGDQRVGRVSGSRNQSYIDGQLAIAELAIDKMAEDIGLNTGDTTVYPQEPIWAGR